MTLGEAIVEFRKENGISQREFARRADLSNSLISIIERGRNPQTGKEMSPDLDTYQKIAGAMGVSTQRLFETLGGDAVVSLGHEDHAANGEVPIFIPDNQKFSRCVQYMTSDEYETLMEIFKNAFKRIDEAEERRNGEIHT